jgi:hypothetical protein
MYVLSLFWLHSQVPCPTLPKSSNFSLYTTNMVSMNKTTLLYYFSLAVSAVVLETTSAAASASLLADKKSPSSVLADNFKLLNVAGDDGRPSQPPSTFLAKASSFLSKKFKNLSGGTPDYLRPSDVDLLEPFNAAYDVSITEDFLSESEIRHYRREGSRLATAKPAVGFSGDRTWEEVFVPKEILRRLINKGAEQCMSQEYEDTLPAGVHILTNHVKETTDPHVDYNPVTGERIENDVAVVFLNTNEDATFVVAGKYGIPIEEGKLVIFPGGSVSHHIEMKNERKKGGFVHMWGPLEVGGSHGIVGQVSRQLEVQWWFATEGGTQQGKSAFHRQNQQHQNRRMLQEEDDTPTSTTTLPDNNSNNMITGEVIITGYTDGIHPNTRETNHTLEVPFNLTGLDDSCNLTSCFYVEIKDSPLSCDGYSSALSPEKEDGDGNHVILKDVAHTDVAQGITYINVNKPIGHLFDKPMVVHAHDGRVLACAMFKEVTHHGHDHDSSGAEDIQKDDNTLSVGAIVSSSWVIAASIMGIVAVLL